MSVQNESFDQLVKEVSHCRACDGLPLGPKPIFQISPRSKVLIAGQAPGHVTHAKGIPFDDASGKRLREWLGVSKEAFYNADNFAIIPMGFCFTGSGSGGDLPPAKLCAQLWRERLLSQITDLKLSVIIGRYAMNWHLPDSKKLSVTDAVRDYNNSLLAEIVLPHPSPRNNIWLSKNPWFAEEVIPRLQTRVQESLS